MNVAAKSTSYFARVARHAAWAPLGVLFLHEVGARLLGHEPYVDPAVHFLGGAAATFFIRYAAANAGRVVGKPTQSFLDLLAFGLTCAVAVFWELGEFIADQYFGGNVQLGLGNTMRDLSIGMAGAIVYLAARRRGGLDDQRGQDA